MQTLWQYESGGRVRLYAFFIAAIALCLLTGTAYGSGMVGSEIIGTNGIPVPGHKPAALIEVSLPATEALPAQSAMNTPQPAIESAVAAPAVTDPHAPRPGRKPPVPAMSAAARNDDDADRKRPDVLALLNFGLPTIAPVGAAAAPVPATKPEQTATAPAPETVVNAIDTASVTTTTTTTTIVTTVTRVIPIPGHKPMDKSVAVALTAPHAVLPQDDASLYKAVFAAQARADWGSADAAIEKIKDRRLMGHVLYQRYMHPSYKTSFSQLENWMIKYADHPGADKIYRMAMNRKPAGYAGNLHKPQSSGGITGYLAALDDGSLTYSAANKRSRTEQQSVRALIRAVRTDIAQGEPTKALKLIETDKAAKLMDAIEIDQLRAHIATGYMNAGKVRKSFELASAASARSGGNVPIAGWTGGLTAWRLGKYKQAAGMFEQVATSPFTSPWMTAAGAYWASRAHMRAGHTREVSKWLRIAAEQPRTFYGLIATRALGWDFDFNWQMPELTASYKEKLDNLPAARRAMALVAAGQYHLAEEELRRINPGKDATLRDALLAYAHDAGLPAFAMRLAEAIPGPDGSFFDAALYPLAPWEPKGGFAVDRALIHAIIRQESRFDPAAESTSGATGLMQLMPRTASYVAKDRAYRDRDGVHSLKDPQINLEIGQRYVAALLKDDAVSADLFSLAIAYNAGPGNLRKWKSNFADTTDDPLLFVETIPVAETRAFVERVLSNYWIYRLRMKQNTPSLDAVAAGNYARYVSLDKDQKGKAIIFASN